MNKAPCHPLKSKAKILLSSVFGPYAQNDEYGSRIDNPMELFHNQVTRVQGTFSMRMFHPSLGLLMIQENIDAPCTLLDFPILDRYITELKSKSYDIIGISSIIPNLGKVKKMCELIRQYQPNAIIVVGGHISNISNLKSRIDADYIVKGEGIRWFRKYLGEDENAPVKHPSVISGFGSRILGLGLNSKKVETAAALIPSVGCPMGCNFCSTSHLFGGKGKSINFFTSGDDFFSVICNIEKELGVKSFFIMDENFLFYKERTLRLLELMIKHKKSWSFRIFSSARIIQSYTDEQLIRLGISWIWMGLEGNKSQYSKLAGVDSKSLVKHLQSLGIRVLGSTIIGLEEHTPENIQDAIDWAVNHDTDFHQFMLYLPIPGTPLYKEHLKQDTLLSEDECALADSHGQSRFNFRHKHLKDQNELELLLGAFKTDFKINGPSLLRLIRTMLLGWKNLKEHTDQCVQDRIQWEYKLPISTTYAATTWAIKRWYRHDKHMFNKTSIILKDLYDEFGWKTKIISRVLGPAIYILMKLEDRRLSRGWTYEPSTQYTKNAAATALELDQAISKNNNVKHNMDIAPALKMEV